MLGKENYSYFFHDSSANTLYHILVKIPKYNLHSKVSMMQKDKFWAPFFVVEIELCKKTKMIATFISKVTLEIVFSTFGALFLITKNGNQKFISALN